MMGGDDFNFSIGNDGDGSDSGKNVGGDGFCDNSKVMRGGGWIHVIDMMKGIDDLGAVVTMANIGGRRWVVLSPSTIFLGGDRSSDGGVVPRKKAMVMNTMVGGRRWMSDLFFGEVLGGSVWEFMS
ncbi:unnamed protein product [Lactuca virosa]|uniref:Uncharacterized protein n=1 Tax=Lactuca virosa TaxID=75947 RepID=A0AAU9PNC0_9ASTR|nr:unnamed protein product [Lactuca virosa]